MSQMFRKMTQMLANSVFCHACPGGQGLVDKDKCSCFQSKERTCEAYLQQELFHKRYSELSELGWARWEILAIFEKEIKGKEHYWYKDNVKL